MQSEQMPPSLLKNGLSLSQFFPSFLSIVGASWEDCRQFSELGRLSLLPLGIQDLNISTCYHANNFQRDKTVEINRSEEEVKGRCEPSSPPLTSVLFRLKSLLLLPSMIKITITAGLPWNFLYFDAVLQRFPLISQANSQEFFRWMSKFVI